MSLLVNNVKHLRFFSLSSSPNFKSGGYSYWNLHVLSQVMMIYMNSGSSSNLRSVELLVWAQIFWSQLRRLSSGSIHEVKFFWQLLYRRLRVSNHPNAHATISAQNFIDFDAREREFSPQASLHKKILLQR